MEECLSREKGVCVGAGFEGMRKERE